MGSRLLLVSKETSVMRLCRKKAIWLKLTSYFNFISSLTYGKSLYLYKATILDEYFYHDKFFCTH